MKYLQLLCTWSGALGFALIVTSCAITDTTTKTVGNTADTSSDATSSTSPGNEDKDSSRASAVAFADINFERLRGEMAVGNGEHLAVLGFLLGVAEAHQQAFFVVAKSRFPFLFDSEQITPEQFVAKLELELAAHPHLLK